MAHVATFRRLEGTLLKCLLLGATILLSRPGQAFEVQPDKQFPASAIGQDSRSTLPSAETAPLVPVDIEDHNKITHVSVGPHVCSLPCRLWVSRGIYPVLAHGQASGVGHLVIDGPTKARFVHQRIEYRTAGTILLTIGLLTPGLIGLIRTCHSPDGEIDPGCVVAHVTTWPVMSAATFITGLRTPNKTTPPGI